jgi:hypothetical protein
MPVSVDWHPDYDDVLLMTIAGDVSMGEALDVTEQESEFVANAGRTVHTIIDLRHVQGIPSNFISNMPRIARMPAANHPNAGQKIVVGASGLAATFLNIFSKVYRKLDMVATLEEADAILNQLGISPSEDRDGRRKTGDGD